LSVERSYSGQPGARRGASSRRTGSTLTPNAHIVVDPNLRCAGCRTAGPLPVRREGDHRRPGGDRAPEMAVRAGGVTVRHGALHCSRYAAHRRRAADEIAATHASGTATPARCFWAIPQLRRRRRPLVLYAMHAPASDVSTRGTRPASRAAASIRSMR